MDFYALKYTRRHFPSIIVFFSGGSDPRSDPSRSHHSPVFANVPIVPKSYEIIAEMFVTICYYRKQTAFDRLYY